MCSPQFSKDVASLCSYNLIGEGVWGKIFKCQDADGEIIAVKKFKKEDDDDEYVQHVISNEMSILQNLNRDVKHTNIINVKWFSLNSYGMEYIDCNLKQWWQKQEDKNEAIMQIIKTLSSALVFLKKNKIVHMDIKYDNVMIRNNACVLIDFGCSVQLQDGDKMYDQEWWIPPCGAFCCAPPEILQIVLQYQRRQNRKHLDMITNINPELYFSYSVDMYCLGVLIYFLYCGEYPHGFTKSYFNEKTEGIVKQLLHNISLCIYERNAVFQSMGAKIQEYIQSMLNANLNERPVPEDFCT